MKQYWVLEDGIKALNSPTLELPTSWILLEDNKFLIGVIQLNQILFKFLFSSYINYLK
jgi:hypothetical protein